MSPCETSHTVSRFPELQGLSVLTKLLAILLVVGGVLGGLALGGDEGFALAVAAVVGAFAYWIQARFIDILLQINSTVIDLSNRPVAPEPSAAIQDRRPKTAPTSAERNAAMSARQGQKAKVDMSAADARPLAWESATSQLRPGTFHLAGSPDAVVAGENVSLALQGLGLRDAIRFSLLDGEARALWLTTTISETDGSLH